MKGSNIKPISGILLGTKQIFKRNRKIFAASLPGLAPKAVVLLSAIRYLRRTTLAWLLSSGGKHRGPKRRKYQEDRH